MGDLVVGTPVYHGYKNIPKDRTYLATMSKLLDSFCYELNIQEEDENTSATAKARPECFTIIIDELVSRAELNLSPAQKIIAYRLIENFNSNKTQQPQQQ